MLKEILQWGDLVFDVGGNIGNKSAEFLAQGARVVLFEPQSVCVAHCRARFGSKVIIEEIGLDSYKGTGLIYPSNAHTLSSMSQQFVDTVSVGRFQDYRWNQPTTIQVDTLDNMIEKYGTPKLIKIDVEGYEINVLKGLTSKIDLISIEFTPELLNSTLECLECLPVGLYNYVRGEEECFKFDWISKDEMVKYLSSIKDYRVEFGDVYIKTC